MEKKKKEKKIMERKWFLTINNYSEKEWEMAKSEIKNCKYGLCCKEVGEEGTPHIHIWLHYKNARSDSSIQKKFKRANKQVGKGRDQDQSYLKKDGIFEEFGEMEQQGKRNDINEIKKIVKEGGKMEDIIDVSTSYQSMKCGELLLKYQETPREVGPIEVHWFYGKPETGKTRKIFDTEVNIFRPTTYKWWEGYDAHQVVLIDDWRPTWCSFVNLLKLTDIYPFRVQTKGGSRQAKYKKIYFTSHLSPREYFEELEDSDYLQLKRRITNLQCFDTEVKG